MSLTLICVAVGGSNPLFYPCYVVFHCSKIPSIYLAFLHFIWMALVLTHKKAVLSVFSFPFMDLTHFTPYVGFLKKKFLLK